MGNWPWTATTANGVTVDLDPATYTNIPTQDQVSLRAVGPVPVLGFAYADASIGNWPPQTPRWLAEHGFRQATVRLVLGTQTSDRPAPLAGDMAALARGLRPQIDNWLAWDANIDCWFQVDCEPDLERAGQDPGEYSATIGELIAALESIYPRLAGRFLRPPLSQQSPRYEAFLAALLPGLRTQPAVCGHYYWGREYGRYVAGAKCTPEWLAQQTGRPVIVTECGCLDDKHDVDYVFRQWVADPAIMRWHWWKISGPSYQEANWDVACVNYCRDFAHDVYRPSRCWPQAVASTPTGDYSRLREHMSAQNALAEASVDLLAQALPLLQKAAGYAREMDDRVQAVWDEYRLGGA